MNFLTGQIFFLLLQMCQKVSEVHLSPSLPMHLIETCEIIGKDMSAQVDYVFCWNQVSATEDYSLKG